MQTTKKLAYTVRDAAAFCSLGKDSIYAAIADGRLTAKKLGRKTLIRGEDLAQFLESLPDLNLRSQN